VEAPAEPQPVPAEAAPQSVTLPSVHFTRTSATTIG
jgi:hypothetical protein